jgi:Transposase IS66 family
MIQAGTLIQPLINLMRDQLIAGEFVQTDETTVQVLTEPGNRAQPKSYLWVAARRSTHRPLVLYEAVSSRATDEDAAIKARPSDPYNTLTYRLGRRKLQAIANAACERTEATKVSS